MDIVARDGGVMLDRRLNGGGLWVSIFVRHARCLSQAYIGAGLMVIVLYRESVVCVSKSVLLEVTLTWYSSLQMQYSAFKAES